MKVERIEAFSDGVFAIAITLLVLNLGIPRGETDLAGALARLWPAYVSYVVSFITIGIIWVNHHALFAQIVRADRTLLFLNLLLLMTVAVIPFPTALLGEYVAAGAGASVAAAVYGGVMTAMGIAFTAIRVYATRDQAIRQVRRAAIGPAIYALGTALAFVNASLSLLVYAGLALFFVFESLPGLTRRDAPDDGANREAA